MNTTILINVLNDIKTMAEKIAGQWNGDESGLMEDKAHCAIEISDKCDELIELLKELDIY